ncbi:MAG: phage holin family protein [Clostridia bacterium]|nr:phage holin family protein [Clostridia bacterium]
MNGLLSQGSAARWTIAGLAALAMAEFQYYAPALALLVFSIILDYVTGMVKAWMKGELDSRVGLQCVIKKLCYILGVAVGFCADLLISLVAATMGLATELPALLGLTVTMMLSLNELLSSLENLGQIGVPMPDALKRALAQLTGVFEGRGEEQR